MSTTTEIPSVHAVADYVLRKIDTDSGDSITNLKLQKIVYYVQAWHLALSNRPAFREEIQAWAHGPVVRVLYARFANYGWQAVDPTKLKTDPDNSLSKYTKQVIDEVWTAYGDLSGSELEALTHSERPWREAYGDRPLGERCTEEISHKTMRSYYRARLDGKKSQGAKAKKG